MPVDTQVRQLLIVTLDGGALCDLSVLQGLWTEEQYLKLTSYTRRIVEFTDGAIEVPRPVTSTHQLILGALIRAFHLFVQSLGGCVLFAALPLRIGAGRFREPDLLLLLDADDPRGQDDYWRGADLVAEVVSPDNPKRDTVAKRVDYAEAGVPEYWIVNPLDETVTVLRLEEGLYAGHGIFGRGDTASSPLLKGFTLDVDAVFDVR